MFFNLRRNSESEICCFGDFFVATDAILLFSFMIASDLIITPAPVDIKPARLARELLMIRVNGLEATRLIS